MVKEVVNFQISELLSLTDSVLQALVEVVNRARRHFANEELSRIFVKRLLKLSLGRYRHVHFTVHLQQLLFERLHTCINSGTKRLFRNTSKTRQLVISSGDAGTNGWGEILHIRWSNGEHRHKVSGGGHYSQVVILQNHFQLVG